MAKPGEVDVGRRTPVNLFVFRGIDGSFENATNRPAVVGFDEERKKRADAIYECAVKMASGMSPVSGRRCFQNCGATDASSSLRLLMRSRFPG